MTITARYDSKCGTCGKKIRAGAKVEWARGQAAVHVSCAAAVAAPAPVVVDPKAIHTVPHAGGYVSESQVWAAVAAAREAGCTHWQIAGNLEDGRPFVFSAGSVEKPMRTSGEVERISGPVGG